MPRVLDQIIPKVMTESAHFRAPALRGWFHDACRLLTPNPPTLSNIGSRSAALSTRTATKPAKCIAVARSQISRQNAVPEPVRSPTGQDIAAEDWDVLFRAALELLACVAAEKSTQEGTGLRLQAPGTALRECLVALDQLRRSVPRTPTTADAPNAQRFGRDRIACQHVRIGDRP
jgi:hypothetical protein